jgi:hypothetical protein
VYAEGLFEINWPFGMGDEGAGETLRAPEGSKCLRFLHKIFRYQLAIYFYQNIYSSIGISYINISVFSCPGFFEPVLSSDLGQSVCPVRGLCEYSGES